MNYATLEKPIKRHRKVKLMLYGCALGFAFIAGVLSSGKFADIKHRSQLAVHAYYYDKGDQVVVVEHTIIVTPSPSPSPALKYNTY